MRGFLGTAKRSGCTVGQCILFLRISGLESVTQLAAIAVTSGPGLSPCLDVGLVAARDLCIAHPSIDFLQINHLEVRGHPCVSPRLAKH